MLKFWRKKRLTLKFSIKSLDWLPYSVLSFLILSSTFLLLGHSAERHQRWWQLDRWFISWQVNLLRKTCSRLLVINFLLCGGRSSWRHEPCNTNSSTQHWCFSPSEFNNAAYVCFKLLFLVDGSSSICLDLHHLYGGKLQKQNYAAVMPASRSIRSKPPTNLWGLEMHFSLQMHVSQPAAEPHPSPDPNSQVAVS